MNTLEIIGTAIGIIYLILEYRASTWLWVASIAMPAIYIEVFYSAGLYADLAINVYYILASIYGLGCWIMARRRARRMARISDGADFSDNSDGADRSDMSDRSEKGDTGITRTPGRMWVPLAGVCAVIFLLLGVALSRFTDSTVPWADAFTTALSIVAMWMLARKYVEQWLVWIVADVACSALYIYKDLYFTSGLYLAYAVIAVLGYRKWVRLMLNS